MVAPRDAAHASHCPEQALLQQKPSEQKPVVQLWPAVSPLTTLPQAVPVAIVGWHTPLASQYLPPPQFAAVVQAAHIVPPEQKPDAQLELAVQAVPFVSPTQTPPAQVPVVHAMLQQTFPPA